MLFAKLLSKILKDMSSYFLLIEVPHDVSFYFPLDVIKYPWFFDKRLHLPNILSLVITDLCQKL